MRSIVSSTTGLLTTLLAFMLATSDALSVPWERHAILRDCSRASRGRRKVARARGEEGAGMEGCLSLGIGLVNCRPALVLLCKRLHYPPHTHRLYKKIQ